MQFIVIFLLLVSLSVMSSRHSNSGGIYKDSSSFSWLNNIPLKVHITFSLCIYPLIDIWCISLEAMLQFSPLKKMLMSFPPSLLSIFYHESALNFIRCLLCIFCSDHVILILLSVNVVYHIDQFLKYWAILVISGTNSIW